jgi:hypothetical protein
MYALIGRWVVRSTVFYLRRNYERQLRLGAGLVAVGIGIAVYLASRNVPEG